MAPFKIAIVGGGITGLSAAVALRKADREIIVLEQSSLNKEIGATISLQPNASKIVEKHWDLVSNLTKKGAMVDKGFQIYDLEGKLQMRIPLSTLTKYGSERIVYHRVDLHDALKERATSSAYPGNPAKIKVSSRVKSCDCYGGVVELESGELIRADLIIGADGIKSVMRGVVLGQEVPARRTGHSAYRMVIPMEELEKQKEFAEVVKPRESFTTMVMGHDRRLIMGPARSSSIYSIVAMVPDSTMNEPSEGSSWATSGNLDKMLETFSIFPEWAKQPLRLAKEAGLWQLRDLDPLPTWYKGRVILLGDSSHAMLPTQGQGASQSIEDAEAVGAYFAAFESTNRSLEAVVELNKKTFECRYERATTIQKYSRQAAKPATDPGCLQIKMNPAEFMDYNCLYDGAFDWERRQRRFKDSITLTDELVSKDMSITA